VARLGHDPTQFTAQVLKVRGQVGSERVVLELLGNGVDLVFKCRGQDTRAQPFDAEIAATSRAWDILSGTTRFRCPRILSHSDRGGWMVQTHEPGLSAKKILEIEQDNPQEAGEIRAEILTVAGSWLSAFHRAGPVERRTIHTATMHDHADTTLASMLTKEIDADNAAVLRALGASIATRVRFADTKQTRASLLHGDFVPQNLLIHKDQITGLDFSAEHVGPNAHDQVKFMSRLYWDMPEPVVTVQDIEQDIHSFEAGYDGSISHDPAFGYLFPIQVLSDLAHPKCAGQRRENLLALARVVVELPLA